jgi:cellulose synthase/poly-beta-1,6-N-acetylglucosamine synthase-like glycosyltransferase
VVALITFSFILFFAGAYAVVMERLLKSWRALPPWEGPSHAEPRTRVSIVVPARNEASRIGACLASLLAQDYPASLREIIVADDFSEDTTAAVVRSFAGAGVRLVSSPHSGKKQALSAGIEAAGGQLIATIDADCTAPPAWLRTMVSYYETHGPVLMAGPVTFAPGSGFLSRFQALDLLGMTALAGAGMEGGFFHLGNGANLLYERRAFQETGGFQGIDRLASGDDVFLMQRMARAFPGRLAYVKSRAALVETLPEPDWKGFWQQRLRWGGKASHYLEWQLTALAVLLLGLCWSIAGAFLLIPWLGPWPFVAAWALKSLSDYRFLKAASRFFGREAWMRIFGRAQLMHVLYIVVTGSVAVFRKSYTWKGRRLK